MKASMILALTSTVLFGMYTTTFASDPACRVDTNIVSQGEIKGEVLKVDGDNYLVKDERSKKEVKFTIEKDVKAALERPLKQGDRIEAFVTPEGFAKSVRFEGGDKGRNTDKAGRDMDQGSGDLGKAGKDLGEIQAPGGFSKEVPPTGKGDRQDRRNAFP